MGQQVSSQCGRLCSSVKTEGALEWLLAGMSPNVHLQLRGLRGLIATNVAFEGLFSRVYSHVNNQVILPSSGVRAQSAFKLRSRLTFKMRSCSSNTRCWCPITRIYTACFCSLYDLRCYRVREANMCSRCN